MQYDFNDYILNQAAVGLDSRKQVELEYIPIINAPMDTVLSLDNAKDFRDVGINLCFPRNATDHMSKKDFVSFGLQEFETLLDQPDANLNDFKICIDVANGNMPALHSAIRKAKTMFPNIIIMSGNVASLQAFKVLALTGCDYIRLGVGSGSGCLTSVHTAVGQGVPTLLQRCWDYKMDNGLSTKLVVDGGFKSYRDIILALAMGADYVMLGGILNKALESCGEKIVLVPDGLGAQKTIPLSQLEAYLYDTYNMKGMELIKPASCEDNVLHYIKQRKILSKFRGMSTKAVQQEWGKNQLQSSEGIEKLNVVEYTLASWMENFLDYLKSSMSYAGCKNLEEFRRLADTEQISPNVYNRFIK